MRALELANRYYDAWANRQGDMTGVPLADDFAFSGPVASFDSAAGFRAMARQAGAMVRNFRVRHQFVDGGLVCSIVDWEMAGLGAEGSADALANQPHTRPMDFTGKTMRIFVFVTAPGVRTDGPWSSWLGS